MSYVLSPVYSHPTNMRFLPDAVLTQVSDLIRNNIPDKKTAARVLEEVASGQYGKDIVSVEIKGGAVFRWFRCSVDTAMYAYHPDLEYFNDSRISKMRWIAEWTKNTVLLKSFYLSEMDSNIDIIDFHIQTSSRFCPPGYLQKDDDSLYHNTEIKDILYYRSTYRCRGKATYRVYFFMWETQLYPLYIRRYTRQQSPFTPILPAWKLYNQRRLECDYSPRPEPIDTLGYWDMFEKENGPVDLKKIIYEDPV